MTSSQLASIRSIALTSIALLAGPVAVLLAAGSRGRWMWDLSRDGGPLWQIDHWLLDPRILGSFALGVVLIALVEAGGGSRAARFRLAVRLAPVAFVVPVGMVLFTDPELPRWLAWPLSYGGSAADPRQLHEVLLTLATPVAFVGTLLPAWWLGARPRSPASLDSPIRRVLFAVQVYLVGFFGASACASPVPPIGILFGLRVAGLLLGLLLLPGLLVSVWVWAERLPDADVDAGRPRSWVLELAALVGSGVLALLTVLAMTALPVGS